MLGLRRRDSRIRSTFHAAPLQMKKRLYSAMVTYAALAVLAGFTLDGVFRYAVWILMAGLAAKTVIAYKAGW